MCSEDDAAPCASAMPHALRQGVAEPAPLTSLSSPLRPIGGYTYRPRAEADAPGTSVWTHALHVALRAGLRRGIPLHVVFFTSRLGGRHFVGGEDRRGKPGGEAQGYGDG